MAGLLGEIFSAGNVAKRKLTDLLGNPVLSAQQFVGNLNDRARNLNEMTSAAAREGMDYGPATQRLAGLMADAYNPVGMFIGPTSKMFNKDMALKASQMEKKGAKPQEIWQTTGTVRGPDGQFRQEISDNKVSYQKDFEQSPPGQAINTFVGDAIEHPELFKAYPQSPNIALGMYPSAANASYQPAANKIVIPNRGESGKSSLLHEIQHAIQEREGFAVGGNIRDFAKIAEEANNKIDVLNNEMRDIVRLMDNPNIAKQDKEALSSQYENLMNQRMSLVKDAQIDPMQAYGNLMGEAEARLTQRRMNLDKEQRLQNFPFEYTGETGYGLDVPLEGLIQMDADGTIIRRGLLGL
jgi:hypothetical protein